MKDLKKIVIAVLVIRAIIRSRRKKKEKKAVEDYLRSQNHETKEPPQDGR